MKMNITSMKINNTKPKKKLPDYKTLYEIYKNEFIRNCENILIQNKTDFINNYFEKIILIIKNRYGEDILNKKDISLNDLKEKCENDFIKDIYFPMRNTCLAALEKYSSRSNKKNFLVNFIPHCSYDQVPLHSCGSKFLQIPISNTNDQEYYAICTGCNKCYYSSYIKMFCPYCHKIFYSKLLDIDNNNQILYPATWEKYHCVQYKINEQMSCVNCGELLWLKNKKLFCKNCKLTLKPEDIIWKCNECGEEFKSNAKIFNPLEYKEIEYSLNDALLYKKVVKPSQLPCGCITKEDINNYDFYHKEKNQCNGILYYAKIGEKDFLICSKCNNICPLNKFYWHCPLCAKKFLWTEINVYVNNTKININENNERYLRNNKIRTSYSSSNASSCDKKEFMVNKNNSYIKKLPENIHKNEDRKHFRKENNILNNSCTEKKTKNIPLTFGDKNTICQDNKFNTTSTFYSSASNNYNLRVLDSTKRKNESIFSSHSCIANNQNKINTSLNNDHIIKNSPINLNNNQDSNFSSNLNNFDFSANKEHTLKEEYDFFNSYSKNSKKNGQKLHLKKNYNISIDPYVSSPKKTIDPNESTQIYVPKKHIHKACCSSCDTRQTNRQKEYASTTNKSIVNKTKDLINYRKIDSMVYNKKNRNNYSVGKRNTNTNIKIVEFDNSNNQESSKKYIEFSLPKIQHSVNQEIFTKLNTRKNILKNIMDNTNNTTTNRNNKYINRLRNANDSNANKVSIMTMDKESYQKLNNTNLNNSKFEKNKIFVNKNDISIKNCKKSNKEKYFSKLNLTSAVDEENKKNTKKILLTNPLNNQAIKKDRLFYENSKKSNNNKYMNKKKQIFENTTNTKTQITEYSSKLKNNTHKENKENKDNEEDDELKEFNFEEYKIITQIGQGTFGKIYLVQNKNGEAFSMKKLLLSEELDVKSVVNEYQMCYKLKHNNIVKIFGIYNTKLDKTTYVVYVLMEIGLTDWEKEIRSYKEKKIEYSEKDLYQIVKQLTSVLAFLQKKNVSHRDIKPQNILVFKNKIYKMADFGEAKQVANWTISMVNNSLKGTELYMSPLLFNGLRTGQVDVKHNLFKSDVYSLGLSLLYASTTDNKSLYDIRQFINMNDVKKYLKNNLGKKYSNKFIDLLCLMLEIHEKNRPDFVELEEIIKKWKI